MNTFSGAAFFVEGDDDSRFIERIAIPCLEHRYLDFRIVEWSEIKNAKVNDLIYSFKRMGYDVVFIRDRDEAPCIRQLKEEVLNTFPRLDEDDVVISVPEIEAWYVAGAPDPVHTRLPPWSKHTTDRVFKELFDDNVVGSAQSRISVMRDILAEFSVDEGVEISTSLRYFVGKFVDVDAAC